MDGSYPRRSLPQTSGGRGLFRTTPARPQCRAVQADGGRGCGAGQCQASARAKHHVVADFVIRGHVLVHADGLLTSDRGYYATYFPELTVG